MELRPPSKPSVATLDSSRTSGWAFRPLLDLQVGLPDLRVGLPDLRVGLPITPGPLGGSPDLFLTFWCASLTLSKLWVGHTIPTEASGRPPDRTRTFEWSSRPLPNLRVSLPTSP